MPLPVASVRDWDHQYQQHFDQTVAKQQSSPLDEEQCKQARTPPQADPKDTPIWDHAQHEGRKNHDSGCLRTRDSLGRQLELDRACSKSRAHSRARSKSCRQSKSRKHSKSRKCSKSPRHSKSKGCGGHEVRKPRVWPSQQAHSRAGNALRKIGPADHRVPVPTVTSRIEMLGVPHIQCPPKTKCPNSQSSKRK